MWNTLHWFVPALEKDGCDIIVWSLLLRWTWWLRRSRMDRRRWLWDLHTETKLKMFLKKRYATRVWIFRCIYLCANTYTCISCFFHTMKSESVKSLCDTNVVYFVRVFFVKGCLEPVLRSGQPGVTRTVICGIRVQAHDLFGSLCNAGRVICCKIVKYIGINMYPLGSYWT